MIGRYDVFHTYGWQSMTSARNFHLRGEATHIRVIQNRGDEPIKEDERGANICLSPPRDIERIAGYQNLRPVECQKAHT
jgi:hypothetical protein